MKYLELVRIILNIFWKYVKSKTKSKEPIGDLYTNDIGDKITATTDDIKAEVLCDFFKCILSRKRW